MLHKGPLSATFTVLLLAVVWPSGCGGWDYGGVCASGFWRVVDPLTLAEALQDESLSHDECVALCKDSLPYPPPAPPVPQPTTSMGAETCSEASTGGTTDAGSETSVGTLGTTSTGPDTASGTSTGAPSCTSGASTTEIGHPASDYIREYNVHTCRPQEGAVDRITCYFINCVE